MKTLAIYHATTDKRRPKDKTAVSKRDIMMAFADGARSHGVTIEHSMSNQRVPSDWGLIFGYAPKGSKTTFHKSRLSITESGSDKNLFYLDNDILKHFNSREEEAHIYRFPYGSIYSSEADYFVGEEDDLSRLSEFKNIPRCGIQISDSMTVIIMLNRAAGYGCREIPPFKWAHSTLNKMRVDERSAAKLIKIQIRPHPSSCNPSTGKFEKSLMRSPTNEMYVDMIHRDFPQVQILGSKDFNPYHGQFASTLDSDINRASGTLHMTSSTAAVSLVHGCPTWITHPDNFAYDFANNDVAPNNDPTIRHDIKGLLKKYVNTHWHLDEIRDGLFWDKVKDKI